MGLRIAVLGIACLVGFAGSLPHDSHAAPAVAGSILPAPPAPFAGKIGPNVIESTPAFPKPLTAPKGAPNILLIMTDDVGFAASSTFGGPIPTPNLDKLAANGLRYNRFNTTAMCSPTRAALLTGRNHHAVATGTVLDFTTGYPGYWSIIPKSAATVGEVLKDNGYNTAWFGKNHNTPGWERSPAGPYDHWPVGLGFEHFYGFMAAETDQWTPTMYRDNSLVAIPKNDPDYILDHDLADEAIRWIHNQKAGAPDKPFFAYYATGSGHGPHQAPKAWIEKFKGKFDQGWDQTRADTFKRQKEGGVIPADAANNPRPAGVPAWDSLSADQKKLYAHFMEVYAGVLAYQDEQVGRVIDELQRMGQLDNTLVMFIEGDNGASAEGGAGGTFNEMGVVNGVHESQDWKLSMLDQMGGPNTYEHYPIGWAWAMNTPFQWFKSYASHLGGVRNGLVVSWPARIKDKGAIRPQFHHVVDIMPTILEAAGVRAPTVVNGTEQQPVDGVSMVYTFDKANAPSEHHVQYFEMLGNRAIYQDGWMANTTPKRTFDGGLYVSDGHPDTSYGWELYDLTKDYSQAHNIAADYPDKLKALEALWLDEAKRNKVLPLDDNMNLVRFSDARRAYESKSAVYDYWGGDISVGNEVMPPILGRSFSIVADVVIPSSGADGVLAAAGSKFGGWGFFLKNGRPVALESFSQQATDQYRVAGTTAIPAGPAKIEYDFDYDGGGVGKGGVLRIGVNGQEVARGRVEHTINLLAERDDTFDIGFDAGTPVSDEYTNGGRFTGDIRKVTVTIKGSDPLAGPPNAAPAKPSSARMEKTLQGE